MTRMTFAVDAATATAIRTLHHPDRATMILRMMRRGGCSRRTAVTMTRRAIKRMDRTTGTKLWNG